MGEPCVPTGRGPTQNSPSPEGKGNFKKEESMSLKPLMEAPDFETQAFANGDFKPVKLSDYKGKWVLLYFYPADFTFG
jgi:hypothetical protein